MVIKMTNGLVIFIVLSWINLAQAQVQQKICAWPQSRAGVVRDSIYLDGGQVMMNDWQDDQWLQNSNPTVLQTQDGTLFKFNFSMEFNVRTSNLTSLFVPLAEAVGPNAAPQYLDGFMFTDDYEFYTYGGLPVNSPSTSSENIINYQLYEPNLGAVRWQSGPNPNFALQNVTNFVTNGAGISIHSEKLGFYFGGMQSAGGGVIVASPGANEAERASNLSTNMIRIDMSEFGGAVWSNITLPSNVQPRAEGQIVWVPVGEKGALVLIGGVLQPADIFDFALSNEQQLDNSQRGANLMTSISVYDIAGDQWYVQNTSGTPPPQLAQFCSVVASADNTSSFEIFVYGGYDGSGYNSVDDIWILSLPAFRWFKAYNGSSNHARSAHFCTTPYPDQMFTIGGQNLENGVCITDGSIVDIFNLNSLQWQESYSPGKWSEYRIPLIVTDVIGGNERGGGTLLANMDIGLAGLFTTKYTKQSTVYYPYASPKPKKSNLLGPVLGAVFGVLTLATVVFLIWRCSGVRRRRRQSVSTLDTTAKNSVISRWIYGNSAPVHVARKSILSETTTELGDPALSPFNNVHEAQGDEYFCHGSPQPVYEVADVSSESRNQSPSPIRSPHSSAVGPGSPQLHMSPLASHSVEVGGLERYEMQGDPRKSRVLEMSAMSTLRRNTNEDIPHSGLDIKSNSKQNDVYTSRKGPASPARQTSSTSQDSSNVSPQINASKFTDVSTSVISIDTATPPHNSQTADPFFMSATSGPMPATLSPVDTSQFQPQWPSHKRNSSSLSSGPSQLPFPGVEEEKRRSAVITNLPESPDVTPEKGAGNIIARKRVGSGLQEISKSAYIENTQQQQGARHTS